MEISKPGEISWDSPWGPGRRAGILSVRSCRQKFWAILLISGGGADLEFHTILTKLPSQKPKQARLLLTTGCTMVL